MQYKDLIYKITSSSNNTVVTSEEMKKEIPDINPARKSVQLKDVLIGIIILSMLLLGYNQISNYYQQQSDNLSLKQIVELNKKFTNYDGKTIRGNEMLSVINSVVDYNTWVTQNANEGYEEIQLNISFEMSEKTDSRWTSFHIEESSSYDYLFPNNSPITNTNMKKISTRKNDLLTKFSNLSQTGFVSSNVVSENTLQLLYKVACLSKKKCYFCTRNNGEVHTNTDIPTHKKG